MNDNDKSVIKAFIKTRAPILVLDHKNLLTRLYRRQMYQNWQILGEHLLKNNIHPEMSHQDYITQYKAPQDWMHEFIDDQWLEASIATDSFEVQKFSGVIKGGFNDCFVATKSKQITIKEIL